MIRLWGWSPHEWDFCAKGASSSTAGASIWDLLDSRAVNSLLPNLRYFTAGGSRWAQTQPCPAAFPCPGEADVGHRPCEGWRPAAGWSGAAQGGQPPCQASLRECWLVPSWERWVSGDESGEGRALWPGKLSWSPCNFGGVSEDGKRPGWPEREGGRQKAAPIAGPFPKISGKLLEGLGQGPVVFS